jgi:hypothetical protein
MPSGPFVPLGPVAPVPPADPFAPAVPFPAWPVPPFAPPTPNAPPLPPEPPGDPGLPHPVLSPQLLDPPGPALTVLELYVFPESLSGLVVLYSPPPEAFPP